MENLKDFMTELKGFNAEQMGAVAYNDTIKSSMTIQNKLEILYLDLIDYVANELGAEKMEALEKIINTFDKNPYPRTIQDEIVCILYGYNNFKNKYYYKVIVDDIIDTEQVVVDKYYTYFYENLDETLNNIIDNYSENGESLEPKVKELIAKLRAVEDKYYTYFKA